MLNKQCLLGQAEMMGYTVDWYLQDLLSLHHIPCKFFAKISGDLSIWGTGPLSKFF